MSDMELERLRAELAAGRASLRQAERRAAEAPNVILLEENSRLRASIARVEALCDQLRGGPSHIAAERFRAAIRGAS